jgi:hypothetical protein
LAVILETADAGAAAWREEMMVLTKMGNTSPVKFIRRENLAFEKILFGSVSLALTCAAVLAQTNDASAVTVEVARKCQALTSKAFPPREPGNPAAGSAKGSGLDQQSYFKKCVANGGRADDATSKKDVE